MGYAEVPAPAGFEPWVACLWRVRETAGGPVLPDGCVDIVWNGSRLVVAGPATRASAPVPAGIDVLGVRFRVGAAGAALGVPARELIDAGVALPDVWGGRGAELERRMEAGAGHGAILDELARRARATGAVPEADPLVRGVLAGQPVEVGERQLRRRFHEAVGLAPSALRGVLRFQRFLARAERAGRDATLARLAADSGYADQAHLSRESRRLAGVPPSALLRRGARAASERALLSP